VSERRAAAAAARAVARAMRSAVVVLGLALALAAPAPAAAEEVSGAQLRALAARAADDPAALERLRGVDAVDGEPVDVGGALRAASGEELRERLDLLASGGERRTIAGDPRADAREIVSQRRFRGTHVEGPFRALLDRVASWLGPIGGLVGRLDRALPGGRWLVWLLLGAAVLALGWVLGGRTIRRRAALAAAKGRGGRMRGESPGELERLAGEAERRGDHEAALRLRFRAGLLRLDARGAISYRPSLQTHEVAVALGSDAFDRLAAGFDEVVYGERPARAEDVEAARRDWEAVLR
jgi:hypothetical protein